MSFGAITAGAEWFSEGSLFLPIAGADSEYFYFGTLLAVVSLDSRRYGSVDVDEGGYQAKVSSFSLSSLGPAILGNVKVFYSFFSPVMR